MASIKVFRPGVFDLFHVGHLNCIKEAAKQGGYLIVGVQDDRDVAECKKRKPVIPLQERMEILDSIKGVDEVISYRNINLSKLLAALDIDVLAVGDDYGHLSEYPDQQATLRYCEENNVRVVRTPRTHGVSSTQILTNISKFWVDEASATMLTSFGGDAKLIQEETDREVSLFGRYISPADRVLDLGCGDGRLAAGLAALCHSIVGVDFSENSIAVLNHRGITNIRGVVSDVCEYDPGDKSFDGIVLSGLFPYLDDLQLVKVLETCKRAVKPGGSVLVRTSIADNERINVINQFSEGLGSLYTAYYRTQEEITVCMEEFGFNASYYEFLYRNHPDTHIGFLSFTYK